jgi:hypothetical protein
VIKKIEKENFLAVANEKKKYSRKTSSNPRMKRRIQQIKVLQAQ